MNTPIDLRSLNPTEHAAVFDRARREAALLRGEAIADAFAALWRAAGRLSASLRSHSRAGLHHSGPRTAARLSA